MPLPCPSAENFAEILHTCFKENDAVRALQLHLYTFKNGLYVHSSLGRYTFSLLVEVGSLHLAQKVFDSMAGRDEYCWSLLINGYVKHKKPRHALRLYETLQHVFLQPNGFTLVNLVKACIILNDVEQGCKLYERIKQTEVFTVDKFVGSAIVSMFVKFTFLCKAQEVCETLLIENVIAWNVLIGGYVHQSQSNEALRCYEQMRLKGVHPNAITFGHVLKACSSLGAIDEIFQIHAEINERGLLKESLFIADVLVDTYARRGMLANAQEVFNSLPWRDVVTWTSLISGYVQCEQYEEALKWFELMQLKGPSPNSFTFACSLKACTSIEAFERGIEIHAELARLGLLKTDPFVGSALIDMYSKWGRVSKAHDVLYMLHGNNNVVTWTALISGYVQHYYSEEAWSCFIEMQRLGVAPNVATFVCILKACGIIEIAERGNQIHDQIVKWGILETDVSIGRMLVDMYIKCRKLLDANEVFNMLPNRDVITWSVFIMGYIDEELHEEVVYWLNQMESEGISPNCIIFMGGLKACGSIQATEKGNAFHAEIARKGLLEKDIFLSSTVVDTYVKCGFLTKAQEVFDMLLSRNVVTWNALINGYAQSECGDMALHQFDRMKHEAIIPNAETYACVLKACARIGAAERGLKVHAEIGRSGLLRSDLVIGTAMIDMYSKCGLLHQAQEVFDMIPIQNVIHWGSLITGYSHQGEIEVALFLVSQMISEGNEPDCATFHIILNGCSHSGHTYNGQTFYDIMSAAYGIPTTVQQLVCVVDLLGRAGQMDTAIAMMRKVPYHPTSTMWHAMLGACKKWGRMDLAIENI